MYKQRPSGISDVVGHTSDGLLPGTPGYQRSRDVSKRYHRSRDVSKRYHKYVVLPQKSYVTGFIFIGYHERCFSAQNFESIFIGRHCTPQVMACLALDTILSLADDVTSESA